MSSFTFPPHSRLAMAQNIYPYLEPDNTETEISDIERSQPYAELSMQYSRPYVGIAVICRCTSGQVFCILQRKGQNSFGSLKWSFPGGRLDRHSDIEENGSVGTKRKLMETCGGGTPHGLPPLIHIIWSQSGKVCSTDFKALSERTIFSDSLMINRDNNDKVFN